MSDKALDKMRRLCSRREYCISDIRTKLIKELQGDKAKAEEALNILIAEKYVDDLRYASAYARDKASISGWGGTKIRYMLSAKGVAKDIITEALSEVDQNRASDRLQKLLENKYKSLKDDPQCKIKLLRFALGRGYGYDDVAGVIDRLLRQGS